MQIKIKLISQYYPSDMQTGTSTDKYIPTENKILYLIIYQTDIDYFVWTQDRFSHRTGYVIYFRFFNTPLRKTAKWSYIL